MVAEWALLRQTDVFVLVYPIWFGAMMMGYIDCVFGAGRTRGSMREEVGSSIAQGKQLVSSTLSGSMSAWFHEKGVVVLLRNLFDRYLVDVFGLAETHDYHFDGIQPGLPSATMHFIWPTRRTRQRKSWPAMRGRTISWLAMRGLVSEELNTVQLRERMPRVSARFDY